jgi:hypothetical protein
VVRAILELRKGAKRTDVVVEEREEWREGCRDLGGDGSCSQAPRQRQDREGQGLAARLVPEQSNRKGSVLMEARSYSRCGENSTGQSGRCALVETLLVC